MQRRNLLHPLAWLLALAAVGAARGQDESPAVAKLPLTGTAPTALADLDAVMSRFVARQHVPGAALAVTRHGRLVYARGFGHADVEAREPVRPTSLFRIASVSKPVTAAAVLQLVERGRLKLDDRVFDLLHYDPPPEPRSRVDPRLRQVTVRHLLQHTGGWDRERSFDPMFRSLAIARALDVRPPAEPEHILRYMMAQPLDFDPGQRSAYSNFGYCVLGRVVEKVSGKPYGEYVRAEVLAPAGIRHMRLGKTLPRDRAPGEVHYYAAEERRGPAVVGGDFGEPVPLPYGAWYLEAMDAHGGWLASAVDLARFAVAFDDPAHCPLLRPASVATLFARPEGVAGHERDGKPREAYYGCGWNVRPVGKEGKNNHWHNGLLDGSASLLVCRNDGIDAAVLFNTGHGPGGAGLGGAIEGPLEQALSQVKDWPEGDLFPDYP